MTYDLNYQPAPPPAVKPWKVALGAAIVAVSLLLLVPWQFMILRPLTGPPSTLEDFFLHMLPATLSSLGLVAAAAVFSFPRPPGAALLPGLAALATALAYFGFRTLLMCTSLLLTAEFLSSRAWYMLSPLLYALLYLLAIGLLIAASRGLVSAATALGRRGLGLLALGALMPSVLYYMGLILYQLVRLLTFLTHSDFPMNFTFIRILNILSLLNLLWLLAVWTVFAITPLVVGPRTAGSPPQ